jgi:hypothetical protein
MGDRQEENMAGCIDIGERIREAEERFPGRPIDCYMLFEDHTDAMAMYELARAEGFRPRISTTPRQAQACCGVALLVAREEAPGLLELARSHDRAFENMIALDRQIDPRRDRYC